MAIPPPIAPARKNGGEPRKLRADERRSRSGPPIRTAANGEIRLREQDASKIRAFPFPARRFHRVDKGPDAAETIASSELTRLDRLVSPEKLVREEPMVRKPETPGHRVEPECREGACPACPGGAQSGLFLLDLRSGETRSGDSGRGIHAPERAEACPA